MKALVATMVVCALTAASAQARSFGIAGTSQQYRALAAMQPSIRSQFLTFGSDLAPDLMSDRALRATAMLTWNPWTTSLSQITAGAADGYLRRSASEIRAYRAPVYIRFAGEMNGNWFPWSSDPSAFVAAWRHIWRVFRSAGANNVRWIWAPDLVTYEPLTQWASVASYWPGARYVDVIGPTFVEFASESSCEVACRFARIDRLHAAYGKVVWLAEAKVDQAERYPWLKSLRAALATRPWVAAVIWSETPSRGQALGQPNTGNMNWSLTSDPLARSLLSAALKP
jgi:Glycosyl hydrolase family 26